MFASCWKTIRDAIWDCCGSRAIVSFLMRKRLNRWHPKKHRTGRRRKQARILVAGIGNIFLGDDGFGVEVVRRLAARELPTSVRVADFGIRGFDLAYALQDGYETIILVDAYPHGQTPGTVSLVEPDLSKLGEPEQASG